MPEYRRPIVPAGAEPTFITVYDGAEARLASDVFAAQWRWVHNQATPADLQAYRGVIIGDQEVETDPDVLDEWARRGEFDLAEVYREMFG